MNYHFSQALGYQVKAPLVLGADDVGGYHKRERLWIYASDPGAIRSQTRIKQISDESGKKRDFTSAKIRQQSECELERETRDIKTVRANAEHTAKKRQQRDVGKILPFANSNEHSEISSGKTDAQHTSEVRAQRQPKKQILGKPELPWRQDIYQVEDYFNRPDLPEPLLWSLADGLASRKSEIKALGNGQVPLVAAIAFLLLHNHY